MRRDVNNIGFGMSRLLAGMVLMVAGYVNAQTTWYVSPSGFDSNSGTTPAAPFGSLSNAIVVANGGDSIHLLAGTHSVSSELVVAKSITIFGVDGAESTMVRRVAGFETFRVFSILTNVVLDGITISNGDVRGDPKRNGGGLFMNGGVLQNCIVAENFCGNHGGQTDTATNGSAGGGMFIMGNTLVSNCVIRNNSCGSSGYDTAHGGGVYMYSTNCRVVDCIITSNSVESADRPSGAGVYVAYGTVERCVISKNRGMGSTRASNDNGGAGAIIINGLIRNCLVAGNSYEASGNYRQGAGVKMKGGVMENCTVVRNYNVNTNGGVYLTSSAQVMNSIVVNNDAKEILNITLGTNVLYSCAPELDGTVSNLGTVPSFKDSGSGYGLTATLGDYQLGSKDAVLNKGTNRAWMVTGIDLVGEKRVIRGVVDMGAYESSAGGGTVLCVK